MKKLIIILTAAVFAVSCSDNLENLNQNIKDPTAVSGESLFASAQKQLADQFTTPNVNLNNNRLWVQHLQEATYTDESNYDQVTRAIPDNHWREMYRDVLKDLDEASQIIAANDDPITSGGNANKLAIIEILTVYSYSNLVETFGDIPYSEALDIENLLPKYDDAFTVYKDLIQRLTAAQNNLSVGAGTFTPLEDLMYGGGVGDWKKFANSLKLRMGMVLADVDAGLSVSTVNSAIMDGVFTNNAETGSYKYSASAPNNNPMNDNLVLSGRKDYVAGKTIIDKMVDLEDPRIPVYFDNNLRPKLGKVESTSTSGNVTTITFVDPIDSEPMPAVGDDAYFESITGPINLGTITAVGASSIDIEDITASPDADDFISIVIYKGGTIGRASPYSANTHVAPRLEDPTEPGVLLSYVEVEFLLAEAAARGGYTVSGDAESHYVAGITASFDYWYAEGLADYLAKPEVNYTSALAASTVDTPWKEVIGTQAWLALYNRTFASWLSVRRLDYPILTKPFNPDSGFPVRYTYPAQEQTLNTTSYNAAASAIGGDTPETRLFWDKFYTFDF